MSFQRQNRSGISFLEFLGCLAALVGGVVLGALYLGIDLKGTALQILAHSEILKIDAPSPLPPNADDSNSPTTTSPPTDEHAAQRLEPTQLGTLGGVESALATVTSLVTGTKSASSTDDAAAGPNGTPATEQAAGFSVRTVLTNELATWQANQVAPEEAAKLTAIYWTELERLRQEEADHRARPLVADEETQLFAFLGHRERGHRQAAEQMAALSQRGVDPHVASFANRILAWHRNGAELFQHASRLLTNAPGSQLSGPFAQSWQSAATQHRMEESLLEQKRLAITRYLAHRQNLAPSADQLSPTP